MIRNLLFDLGGVIMDIRRERCIEAFRDLGMAEPGQFLGEYVQAGPFGALEAGEITPAQFRDELRRYLPSGTTDTQIDVAFERFLIGVPVHRLQALERLRERYRLFLLSNTNEIMWNSMIAAEFRKEGHDIAHYFDGTLTSFEARSMKPDAAIFRIAEQKFGIKPGETLFLDDSASNTEAAAALGFAVMTVPPGSEFMTLLKAAHYA